jgi:hypothetical protein
MEQAERYLFGEYKKTDDNKSGSRQAADTSRRNSNTQKSGDNVADSFDDESSKTKQ